ncbi:hypothetical protein DFH09DRAFT_1282433 [Mycena vulgaris]|nr:hypothetical protein DFH09DRAFT_1282433 [Mycena vulgaris]
MGRNIFGLDLDAVNVVAVSPHMTRKRGPPLGVGTSIPIWGGSGRGSKKTFRPYIRFSNPDSPLDLSLFQACLLRVQLVGSPVFRFPSSSSNVRHLCYEQFIFHVVNSPRTAAFLRRYPADNPGKRRSQSIARFRMLCSPNVGNVSTILLLCRNFRPFVYHFISKDRPQSDRDRKKHDMIDSESGRGKNGTQSDQADTGEFSGTHRWDEEVLQETRGKYRFAHTSLAFCTTEAISRGVDFRLGTTISIDLDHGTINTRSREILEADLVKADVIIGADGIAVKFYFKKVLMRGRPIVINVDV